MTTTWAQHLLACLARGAADFHRGTHENPYRKGHHRTGVQRQRADYWQKGHDDEMMIASDQRIFDRARAEAGTPTAALKAV